MTTGATTADAFATFATQGAAGLLGCLPLVTVREGGRRFFETTVVVALAALALGSAVRIFAAGEWTATRTSATGLGLGALALGFAALKVLQGASFEKAKPILVAASGLGSGALVADAARTSLASAPGLVCGAALIGSVTLSMILGHFYLMIPRLSIDPLRRLTNAYLVSIVARTVLALAGVALVWNVEVEPGRSLLMHQTFLLVPRFLFGIAGLLLLCFLARGTVAISSTQSATGILYGATVFVVIGELSATYLALTGSLPV